MKLMRSEKGFTLVELIITMLIFMVVIVAASNVFSGLLYQYKQQSKIGETNIEGLVGLEMLRYDLDSLGYGLPWNMPATAAYTENPAGTYNDCSGTLPCNPPRAIVIGNGAGLYGSDELVIKATNISRNAAAHRWTILQPGNIKVNGLSGDSFANTDRIIVISPGSTATTSRILVTSSLNNALWSATYIDGSTTNFDNVDGVTTNVIYGIAEDSSPTAGELLWMPFNRADYYLSAANLPSRCATGTAVLMKAVISHVDGSRADFLPLLDCVADMQVVFGLDMDDDGNIGTYATPTTGGVAGLVSDVDSTNALQREVTDGTSTVALANATLADAALLRSRLKEVRVYILAHEGQRDPSFTYNNPPTTTANPIITVGEFGIGRDFNFTANGITNWANYRWKVYTIVVSPSNLGR